MLRSIIAVAGGGALGSLSRYFTVIMSQYIFSNRFPMGTLLVNMIGSFLVGFFMSFYVDKLINFEFWRLWFVVGFLGAYTTFSSFAWDTWMLYLNGQGLAALFNILLNNLMTLLLLFMGVQLGRTLGGAI